MIDRYIDLQSYVPFSTKPLDYNYRYVLKELPWRMLPGLTHTKNTMGSDSNVDRKQRKLVGGTYVGMRNVDWSKE